MLEGHRFQITTNLYHALEYLRKKSADYPALRLCIDSMCINQNDPEERNSQVGGMKSIYEHTNEVCVWLGTAADDSTLVFKKIDDLAEYYLERMNDVAETG